MKNKSLIHLFIFVCIPFFNLNAEEVIFKQDNIQVFSSAVEKASQVFRKFETVSLSWKEEISKDQGKTWEMQSKFIEIVDKRIGMDSTKTIQYEEDAVSYSEAVIGDGKATRLQGYLTGKAPLSWEAGKKLNTPVIIIEKSSEIPPNFPIFLEDCSGIDVHNLLSPKHGVRLFSDEKGKTILEVKGRVGVADVFEILWFDAKTGTILRYFREGIVEGKKIDGVSMIFENHKNIMGWNLPQVKTVFYPQVEVNGKIYPPEAIRYSAENMEINQLPQKSLSSYSITIPVGAYVNDKIKGISYKHSEIGADSTTKTITQELDNILDTSEKAKETAKKE